MGNVAMRVYFMDLYRLTCGFSFCSCTKSKLFLCQLNPREYTQDVFGTTPSVHITVDVCISGVSARQGSTVQQVLCHYHRM